MTKLNRFYRAASLKVVGLSRKATGEDLLETPGRWIGLALVFGAGAFFVVGFVLGLWWISPLLLAAVVTVVLAGAGLNLALSRRERAAAAKFRA
jgi:hypothetical protein